MIRTIIENKSKNKIVYYDDNEPLGTKVLVSNDKLTKFRANSGEMGPDMKRYVAVIYEIKEEI